MKFHLTAMASALAVSLSYAADKSEYFDCWLEPASNLSKLEQFHMGVSENDAVCGCYRATENPKVVTRIYDVPKPSLMKCANGSCLESGHYGNCMEHLQKETIKLSDLAKGAPMHGAIPLTYEDGWSLTPFGEYFNKRKDRAEEIDCFVNVHKRPEAAANDDWNDPAVFKITGLPKILIPEAIGRTPDFSDLRCLDNGELSGFAFNGVLENVRHVNAEGEISGEVIGYMNDPTYPVKQSDKWGKVLWKANYKRGLRDGVTTIYKSNVFDNNEEKEYYFKHLEVNYKQGFVDGTTKMYSDKGFLMADIPMKRGAVHGRMTVYNPFKKKNLPLNFYAGKLEGFNDFADFGGVFHEGLPNGLITYWSVKDSCYEWMPGGVVCHTERLKKKQWGTYKMGKFQGTMECHNGKKGGIDMVCPDPVQDSIKNDPQEIAKNARAVAEKAKQEAAEAREQANQAEAAAKKAEDAAKKAEQEAVAAEKAAEKAAQKAAEEEEAKKAAEDGEVAEESEDNEEEAEEEEKPAKKSKKDKKGKKADKKADKKASKKNEKKSSKKSKS